MRRLGILGVGLVLLSACGGGGGGGGSGGTGGNPPPPGGQTTYYVRASGSDATGGGSPDRALRTIGAAVKAARPGATIVVGPGIYPERIVDPPSGKSGAPITYLADPTGTLTTDTAGPVIIDATDVDDPKGSGSAIRLSAATYVVIDGFEITGVGGDRSVGIFIRSKTKDNVVLPSHDITIRNCRISTNAGDGVRVDNSNDVLLFNNLIVGNVRRGVVYGGDQIGSQRPQLINNTIAGNLDRGVFIGEQGAASSGALLRNNILQDNGGSQNRANLQVDDGSLDGFDSAFNLVFPPRYNPSALPHDTDVNADALLVEPADGDYHLDQHRSPAIDAGDSDFDGDLLRALQVGSTDPDGRSDIGDPDLGYHYPTDQAIPPPGEPRTLYVRGGAGDDDNDGLSPEQAVRSLGLALVRAREGDTVIVGPGLYTAGELRPRDGTTVLADADGAATGDEPGEVRVDARSKDAAFLVDRAPGAVIDGFVITRASLAGIIVRNASHNTIIRNCQVRDGFRDGIVVSDSDNVLVFNNLVTKNRRQGIGISGTASGSTGTRVINNTIALNRDRGLRIGDTAVLSPETLVQNNIIQGNSPNIQVIEGSETGYRGRYNVVFEETYAPVDLPRTEDINEDAEFVDSRDGDFHLDQRQSPAIDAADPDTDPPLVTRLRQRTTAADAAPDSNGDLDIGFHYR